MRVPRARLALVESGVLGPVTFDDKVKLINEVGSRAETMGDDRIVQETKEQMQPLLTLDAR